MKIANIVGARPQIIKYFPVLKAIERYNNSFEYSINNILVHTGQHYDYTMSEIFFKEFGISEPEYHLGVGSSSHGEQTGKIVQKVESVLKKEKPDIVIVYGDTNSTLGGALAAVKLHLPVAHIEAGTRSYNKYLPEEINRILTDHISTLLFCPSETAVNNLKSEGFKNILNNGALISLCCFTQSETIKPDKNNPVVINVGDVMYDVLLYTVEIAEKQSKILEELKLVAKDYCLLTLHRAENIDILENFEGLIEFVNNIFTDKTIIFPMHPRAEKVYEKTRRKLSDNIRVINPVGYFDVLMLLKNSALLMTDSGGMQKEAYWLKVPCITLREETEWIETVQSGWNVLNKNYHGLHKNSSNLDITYYGDGRAAYRIINILMNGSTKES